MLRKYIGGIVIGENWPGGIAFMALLSLAFTFNSGPGWLRGAVMMFIALSLFYSLGYWALKGYMV